MSKTCISRHDFLCRSAFGALAAAVAPSCATRVSPRNKRPNFVIVFSDDHCYRSLGYNNPVVKTPNLDRIARGGMVFDHCYIASPICVASRASMMSGLFPQQHGAVGLDARGFQRCVVEEKRYRTFAHVLSGAGYTTAFCGKSHLGDPKAYGFDEGNENNDIYDNESFDFASAFLASRKNGDGPFLLWVAPHQPHVPLLPAQQWLDLYNESDLRADPNFAVSPPEGSIYNQGLPGERYYRDSTYTKNYMNLPSGPPRTREQIIAFMHAYYATVSHLDHQIGKLFDQLRESPLYENTTFIYMSDNGYHLGNHGLGNKITMHEESVRVPMFAHGHGVRKRGTRSQSLVSSLDLYPTLLDLAGVPIPDHLMGKSIASVMLSPDRTVREYVASECVGVGGKVGQGHRMVRSDRWKYVLTDSNDEALFDEPADPYEMNNVIAVGANVPVVRRHRKYMSEWMKMVGDLHAPPPQ